ncbi:putative phytosulfokine [Helianthus annuus]|nr:putative phytosulfokine [Helianthus annuus]
MSRPATLFLILALLLCSKPSYAARPLTDTITKHQNKGVVETAEEIEQGCQGVDQDECLMRRTLVAHLDYIYTQNKNP